MEGEVHPGQNHKEYRSQLQRCLLKITKTGIVGGETANRHRTHGMIHGIKRAHTEKPVYHRTGQRHTKIEIPEQLGCFGDTGCQFILNRAGRLGTKQLHAAYSKQWHDGYGQYDDPHTTKPLLHGSPEQNRARQMIQTGDDSRPGCSQARCRFKHGIDNRWQRPGRPERHRTDQRKHQPGQRHNHKPVTMGQVFGRPATVTGHAIANQCHDGSGFQKLRRMTGIVIECHNRRDKHAHAIEIDQHTDCPDYTARMHRLKKLQMHFEQFLNLRYQFDGSDNQHMISGAYHCITVGNNNLAIAIDCTDHHI